MSLDFFLCKIPIPYDESYVYDACNVLVKSYSIFVVAATRGIVLVKSATGLPRGGEVEVMAAQSMSMPGIFLGGGGAALQKVDLQTPYKNQFLTHLVIKSLHPFDRLGPGLKVRF